MKVVIIGGTGLIGRKLATKLRSGGQFGQAASSSSSISSANAGLALYCPLEEARTLIILTILFVLGRVLFWVGYHINPYVRAFGFGLTFYPTVVVYAWLILAMLFGIRVPL